MTDLTLYHNPRCSKSRGALELLEARGLTPTVVRYLETPLDAPQLRDLLAKLNISARQLLRSGEDEYKALNLADASLSEAQLIDAMAAHPKLIERPVLVVGDKAVIGRPPEKVLFKGAGLTPIVYRPIYLVVFVVLIATCFFAWQLLAPGTLHCPLAAHEPLPLSLFMSSAKAGTRLENVSMAAPVRQMISFFMVFYL